jgi:hypothetical protein
MNAEKEFKEPDHLCHVLRSRSKPVKDLVGREIMILEDSQASKITHDYNCKIHEIYIKALSMGVCPYRYLRNREAISTQDQLKLANSRVTVVTVVHFDLEFGKINEFHLTRT